MRYQLTIDDFIGSWGYSKRYVRSVLSNYTGKHVDVKISSLGGDLNHALDIRKQFIDHGDVTAHISGFAASAATVIAMGAKRVVIDNCAFFLVHKCSNFIDAWGNYNADQMQQLIDQLTENKQENDKIDVVLANMYAERCNKKVSEILDILKRGAWLTAKEALDLGFVDEIVSTSSAKQNITTAMFTKFNALGITTDGLPAPSEPDEITPKNSLMDKKRNFKSVEQLLKLDAITPDNDGYVSLTANQFEQVCTRLDSLESSAASAAEKDNTIAELNRKVNDLTAQVENLKKLPGDETDDIKDDAGEAKKSSLEYYNEIKDLV